MQENVNEVCYKKLNVREDMFCFQLDASDSISMVNGERIYGDCHLVALVHTFQDFKELNGQLYLVKSALCVVTNSQENFELLYELMEQNMHVIKIKRMDYSANPMLDESVYPREIKACL